MSKAQELARVRRENGLDIEPKKFKNVACEGSIDEYYEKILSVEKIEEAVSAYGDKFDKISSDFSERTKLNKVDCAFLVLAVALQCARQYLLTNFSDTIDENATKESDKKEFKEKTSNLQASEDSGSNQGGYYFSRFEQICGDLKVPYDTINGSKNFNLGLGGVNHRYKTVGHDPILGYIFGTMNILTNTLTTWNFTSYHIRSSSVHSNASTAKAFSSMADRVCNDPTAVAAALIKQHIHIKSDMYTPNKIPFPFISEISPDLSRELSKYGLNFADVATMGKQASLSIAINTLIAMLHRLMMVKGDDKDENLYKVKTKKILLYSNLIATSSNLIYCGVSQDYKKLDIGGFAVTMYRLFSDTKFIEKLKYEFLNTELSKSYNEEYKKIEMYYSK